MFDVSWTDPARETVGERRSRKEQNGKSTRKQVGLSRKSSMRSSKSSLEVTSKPSLLNLFGSGSSKKLALDPRDAQFQHRLQNSRHRRISSYTTGSETSINELSSPKATTRDCANDAFDGRDCPSDAEHSNPSEAPESVSSGWNGKSSYTDSSWSSVIDTSTLSSGTSSCLVQSLSPNSYVTQSTEVTVSRRRESIKVDEQLATTVKITAAQTLPVQMQNVPDSPSRTASPPSTFAFPLPLPLLYAYPPLNDSCAVPGQSKLAHREVEPKADSQEKLRAAATDLTISSKSCPIAPVTRWPAHSSSRDRLRNVPSPISETWKPPETWECQTSSSDSSICSVSPTAKTHLRPRAQLSPRSPPPLSSIQLGILSRERDKEQQSIRHKSPPNSVEIMQLQRSIRRMEAASKKIMLERLREEWTEIADASVYRELELEKQMWMLTALRSFDGRGRGSIDGSRCGTPVFGEQRGLQRIVEEHSERRRRRGVNEQRGKVLSLYENHASASSLAAMVAKGAQMHHLSTAPLSAKQYPNVHPLTVPSATTHLPYASNIFSSVHAFSLPSLLPASSIPSVLKECHRVLISELVIPKSPALALSVEDSLSQASSVPLEVPTAPLDSRGGSLHLTVLDPSPLPASLGPRLRTWLDDNLILNLEKQFRCINPSRLFPDWLADAGLRAEGSTVVYVKFFASVPSTVWSRCSSTAISRREDDDDRDPATLNEFELEKQREKEIEDSLIKQELKSVVGRMLWKEMWGPYVQAEKWWWEDENIVDECERMGTVWEFAVIEAVKGE